MHRNNLNKQQNNAQNGEGSAAPANRTRTRAAAAPARAHVAHVNALLAIRQRNRFWFRMALAAMVCVVFCVTYALILPAITASNTTYCGQTEHTHIADCYALIDTNGTTIATGQDALDQAAELGISLTVDTTFGGFDEQSDTQDAGLETQSTSADAQDAQTQEATTTAAADTQSQENSEVSANTAQDAAIETASESASAAPSPTSTVNDSTGADSSVVNLDTTSNSAPTATDGTSPDAAATTDAANSATANAVSTDATDDAATTTQDAPTDAALQTLSGNTAASTPTLVLTCGQTEHTHTDACTIPPDSYTFTAEDETISATITVPFSADLPTDLSCALQPVTQTATGYSAMYNSAYNKVASPGQTLESMALYQLVWTTADGSTYTLPDNVTATVVMQYKTVVADDEILNGVVIDGTENLTDSNSTIGGSAGDGEGSSGGEGSTIGGDTLGGGTTGTDAGSGTGSDTGSGTDTNTTSTNPLDYAIPLDTQPIDASTLESTNSNPSTDQTDVGQDEADEEDDSDSSDTLDDYLSGDAGDGSSSLDTTVSSFTDGATTVQLKSNSKFGVLISAPAREGAAYFERVDDVSEIISGDTYVMVFANGVIALDQNQLAYTGKSGYTSAWTTNQRVVVQPVRPSNYESLDDSAKQDYFVIRKDGNNYISDSDKTLLWKFTGSSSSGFNITNLSGRQLWMGIDKTYYDSYYNYYYAYGTKMYFDKAENNAQPTFWMYTTVYDNSSSANNVKIWLNSDPETKIASYETNDEHEADKAIVDNGKNINPLKDGGDITDDILIYHLVDPITEEDDAASAANTNSDNEVIKTEKPKTYTNDVEDISMSENGSVVGELGVTSATAQYASDASTSQIEKLLRYEDLSTLTSEELFETQSANDGRVLTDKSTIYGADDYDATSIGAYGSYEAGDFSTTLSALGQEWTTKDPEKYKTPLDVVFILDTSTSMYGKDSYVTESMQRWEASAQALNDICALILEDANNRIGLVTFSTSAEMQLPLDHYTFTDINNKNILSYTSGINNYSTLKVSSEVKNSSGYSVSGQTISWGSTYTQAGLQQAYNVFENIEDTTVEINGEEVARQPVFILLSDGAPSIGSFNFMNPMNDAVYDNGVYPYASLGYYTILSANYFKNKVSMHYGKKSNFYTIGLGVTDYYSMATLSPDEDNVAALSKTSSEGNAYPSKCKALLQLLNGETSSVLNDRVYYATSNMTNPNKLGKSTWGYAFAYLTAISTSNPYKENYCYANDAFFGNMTAEELTATMKKIIQEVEAVDVFGFLLEDDTSLEMTDTLGSGMTVKGQPVLRYFGKNYAASSVTTGSDSSGTYTQYVYNEKDSAGYAAVKRQTSNLVTKESQGVIGKSEQEIDISTITVKVYDADADAGTNARVVLDVPDEAVPVYYPDLYSEFFYEELPVRLIYRVGLSQSEINKLNTTKTAIDATYYVSDYTTTSTSTGAGGTATTVATFKPAVSEDDKVDTYYDEEHPGNYATVTTNKTANTTSTASTYFTESVATTGVVTQTLGNNGVLKIQRAKLTPEITIEKAWPNGEPASTSSVAFKVYQTKVSGGVEGAPSLYQTVAVTKNAAGTWTATFDAPDEDTGCTYNYYVVEDPVVDGYSPVYLTVPEGGGEGAAIAATQLTVAGGSVSAYAVAPGSTIEVANYKMYSLPSSGGPGAAAPVAAGCAVVAVAAAGLLAARRRQVRR